MTTSIFHNSFIIYEISSPKLFAKIRELLDGCITVYAPQRPDRAFGLKDSTVRDPEFQQLAAAIWGVVDGKQVNE